MTRLDFDPDLERLGEALRASTTIDLAREERAARPTGVATRTRRTRRRPRLLAGGTLGLAGVGAALVLALGGTAATRRRLPSRPTAMARCWCMLNINSSLPQVNPKLAAMGTHEQIGIAMASGPAAVSGPVTCTPAPPGVGADGEGSRWPERHRGDQPGPDRRQHRRGHLAPGLLQRVPG